MSGTTNKKEEETAVSSVTEGTTVVLGMRPRTGSDPGGGIDLLTALQLHNTTRQGVTQVPGLVRLRPAYYLQGESTLFGIFSRARLFFEIFSKFLIIVYMIHKKNSWTLRNSDFKWLISCRKESINNQTLFLFYRFLLNFSQTI